MNVTELSDLAYVLEQAKVVLNTSSNSRYPKEKIHELKRKVSQLEDKFLHGVLGLDPEKLAEPRIATQPNVPAKSDSEDEFKRAIAKARDITARNKAKKVDGGAVVVEAPEEVVAAEVVEKVTPAFVLGDQVVEEKSTAKPAKKQAASDDEDMAEFRRKLAEEKKKLASRKKKAE